MDYIKGFHHFQIGDFVKYVGIIGEDRKGRIIGYAEPGMSGEAAYRVHFTNGKDYDCDQHNLVKLERRDPK